MKRSVNFKEVGGATIEAVLDRLVKRLQSRGGGIAIVPIRLGPWSCPSNLEFRIRDKAGDVVGLLRTRWASFDAEFCEPLIEDLLCWRVAYALPAVEKLVKALRIIGLKVGMLQ